MRASVVLTCYCWLLVRVSEPAPPSRGGASCSGPLGSPPESSRSGQSVGPAETIQSRMRPTEALPIPGLLDSLALFLFSPPSRVRQKWGPGSPRPPLPGRPGSWSGSFPGVGDIPRSLQKEWPLSGPPALALLPRETAVTLWLNISLSISRSVCLFSM